MSTSLRRRPLADEVAHGLAELIRTDAMAVGDRLPAITSLAERLGVSRTVIREAVNALAERGVLSQGDGKRWTVARLPNGRRRGTDADEADGFRFRSLSDQAADAVLKLIVDRKLAEGDPLPSSGDLAKRYGVSVLVIREALAGLSALGILERRQGRESVVAAPSSETLASVLRLRAQLESIQVDEFMVCRSSLETQAAVLAAANPDTQLKRELLMPHVEGMARARSGREFNDHDLAFHLTLAELSGNRAIALVLEALHDVVRSFMDVTYRIASTRDRSAVQTVTKHHSDIAQAIIDGDVAATVAAVETHFAYVTG